MPFPLRLTPFEEYMLLDDQPAYPMSCFFKITLQGKFDVSVFESALQQALEIHPLLTCSVKEIKGQYYWHPINTISRIIRLPIDPVRSMPVSCGSDLLQDHAFKVTICHECFPSDQSILDGQTEITFEYHHSQTDAAGSTRFIEDILCFYALQQGVKLEKQREPVDSSLLGRRGQFAQNGQDILRSLPKQLWGLPRAWMFLLNKVVPLTDRKPVDRSRPDIHYPAVLCKKMTQADTESVIKKTKELGITINDYFLCHAFLSIKNGQENEISQREKGNIRLAVPTNLRTPADNQMPAANVVSMVFLDRKPKSIMPTRSFYQGVHREMRHIKRCHLGWAFIHGLTLYRRLFGNFRKMMSPNRCWTTATVTNLGRLFSDIPLPTRKGYVQIDDSLALVGVEGVPPIRTGTALGICVMTYADSLTINMHYDSSLLSQAEALSLLKELTRT